VRELLATRPDRIVWASDWPHAFVKGRMPNTTDLLDMLLGWLPDDAAIRRILVDIRPRFTVSHDIKGG
jgi:predicted TIM-barrel fold metal-dependent hydrolase